LLLTGCRLGEALALRTADVSLDRQTLTIRGTKTAESFRAVPLWPQLAELLGGYLAMRPPAELLFASPRTGRWLTHVRKSFRRIREMLGWSAAEWGRAYDLRHSYCSARLQTLDRSAPVSPFTVAAELGHRSLAMVQKVYGHLGVVRQRGEVVEYRIGQHVEALREQLEQLGWREYIPPSAAGSVTPGVTPRR
jgi:integrase